MKHSPDLTSLAADYDIIGELDASADSRTYIATRRGDGTKRRDDTTGVLVTVVTTPEGDEANALSHLAADTKLLARTPHRRLMPVLDGRWLGDDAFAVVTQRVTDPSLAQLLASGETFTNPRIAAILREVNGLLEWARDQQIVHRNIPLSTLFLEPKTDRVRVTFAIAPIQRLHRADAHDDARTIATLAMAMLTGEANPQAYEGRTLAELRADLPERLGEATTALLDDKNTGATPDVAAYLALIGMADPVAAGEAERERIRTDILEEQRAEREKLAAERASFEQTMADERASFERTMAAERAKLEAERLELQKAATRERDELQRAATAERALIATKHAELERIGAERLAALEQAAERDRALVTKLREALRRAGEHEIEKKRQTALDDITEAEDALDAPELEAPRFVVPMLAPLEPLVFNDDSPLMRDDDILFATPPDEAAPIETSDEPSPESAKSPSRRKWILVGAAAGILALIGISASVVGSRQPAPASKPAARTAVAAAQLDSAPIAVAPVAVVPPPPTLAMDSATRRAASRWLDSLKEANPVVLPRPVRIVREPSPTPDSTRERVRRPTINEDPFFIPGSSPPRDTSAPRPPAPRPDTTRPPPA